MTLVYRDPKVKFGYHINKEKTLFDSFSRLLGSPLSAYQIYISNSRSWKEPSVDLKDIELSRNLLKSNGRYACVHASLLYNIAGATNGRSDPKYNYCLDCTRKNLMTELDISAGIGAGTVVHTGSRKDKDEGLKDTVETINKVLKDDSKITCDISKMLEIPIYEFKKERKLILENSAGEGNKLGSTLLSISEIIYSVDEDIVDQVKVCIDTAHAAGSGEYDFGNPEEVVRFYQEFDDIIGLSHLELFHLNDSRAKIGSKRDLHENLGLGYIFSAEREDGIDGSLGLKKFVHLAKENQIPFIGEPPAKTLDGKIGPGGKWDYDILRNIYKIEDRY